MRQPVTFHTVSRPGRHYPNVQAPLSPLQAMLAQQQQRADSSAVRQQLVRMYLGGRRPLMAAS